MEENKNQEEDGIALGEIFHWINKGKIVGLIAAVITAVVLLIVMVFVLNPRNITYQVGFDYSNVPGIGNGNGNGNYIDGTCFNYLDIITEESVNEVLATNEAQREAGTATHDFSTIDIDKLFESNEFTIDINRVYYEAVVEGEAPELKATNYLINMPTSPFKDSQTAKAFAIALINIPLEKTIQMIQTLDFTTNLEMYNEVANFDTKLNYITNQVNLLLNGYSNLNSSTNGIVYTIDGTTYNFTAISARINDFLRNQNYSTMADEIRQKGYVNDKDVARLELSIQMDDLVKEHDYLEAQLEAVNKTYTDAKESLNGISSGTDVITTEQILALLTQLNNELITKTNSLNSQILANEESQRVLNIKINALENLSDEENNKFLARLNAIATRLTIETEIYDIVYKNITSRNMYVYYTHSNVIDEIGDMGAIMKFGVPVVAAVVLFLCVSWGYGYSLCKKEENNKSLPKIEETTK